MTEADLIVSEAYYPDLPLRFWQAKCRRCKAWITKYDFTREECVELALEVHVCPVQRDAQMTML